MRTCLEIYKEFKEKNYSCYKVGTYLVLFNSINTFIDNPTDDEYWTIANICYRCYMKYDGVEPVRICDEVYAKVEIALGK